VRGEAAPEPRNSPQSRTSRSLSANVDLAAHKTRTRIGGGREQSAVTVSPQPPPRNGQSALLFNPCPGTVHKQAMDNQARSNFCAEIP